MATLILNNGELDFFKYANAIVETLFFFIFILLGVSIILYWQVKKLHNTEVVGDEEDEVDLLIYKKYADYSFFAYSSIILSVLVLCTTIITSQSIIFTAVGIVTDYCRF